MSIAPIFALSILIALVVGGLLGWLARASAHRQAEMNLRATFQSLSAEALHSNNQAFLDLAESRLREARTEATSDIDARKKAIEDLLTPFKQTLDRVDTEIKESEHRRIATGADLVARIASLDTVGQNLRAETARLVDSLKRPGVRGRWGELQLKRVVELAGMVEYCDFEEQKTITNDDRRMRPDVIVRLPGGKFVVIDAKAPLDAYLRALEAPDEATRQALLADHARQVRQHITLLSAKGYAANVHPSPDLVVMFLPGEMFFSAALEQDPSLIEFGAGLAQRVIPASPTTLIALLRAVAYGWQQEAMEENARRISDLGRNLYDAVGKLGEHFGKLGRQLKSSLEAYNDAVGSLEGNVLVKARRFKELQATSGGEDIPALDAIDRVPRMLQAPELTDGLPFNVPEEEVEPEEEVAK